MEHKTEKQKQLTQSFACSAFLSLIDDLCYTFFLAF